MIVPHNVIESRIQRLRKQLADHSLEALILINDEKRGWENLYYLSGFKGSSAVLTVTHDTAILVTDSRYITQARQQCCFEVRETPGRETQNETVFRLIGELKLQTIAFDDAALSAQTYMKLASGPCEWKGFASHLAQLRRQKDEWEIQCISRACEIASQAYLETLSSVHVGMTELEFSKLLELAIARRDGEGVWHDSDMIVASGVRSAMPHGVATAKKMERGDQVTVDFGAIFGAYMSDITRNFSLGQPSHPEFLAVHEVLINAHRAAASLLRPCIAARTVHEAGQRVIANAGFGACFGHAIGHSFGLEIHEKPYLSPRSGDTLEIGDIVTIEPGIYVPEKGGLRLEDDYLIVKDGAVCLTKALPQEFVRLPL